MLILGQEVRLSEVLASRIPLGKGAPVGLLIGLPARSKFCLPTIPSAMKIPHTAAPRSRRVTAKHVSGGFGVSGDL